MALSFMHGIDKFTERAEWEVNQSSLQEAESLQMGFFGGGGDKFDFWGTFLRINVDLGFRIWTKAHPELDDPADDHWLEIGI